MLRHRLLIAALCLLGPGAAACFLTDPGPSPEEELEIARARWVAADLRTYAYTRYVAGSEIELPPARVLVTDGVVSRVILANGEEPTLASYRTVEELFAFAAEILANDPPMFRAEYDPVLGYPYFLGADPDSNFVDDEFLITLADFTPSLPADALVRTGDAEPAPASPGPRNAVFGR